jgi:hypothetical protein
MNPFIDISKFIKGQLQPDFRVPVRVAWLEALLETLDVTLNTVQQSYLDKIREIAYSGQTAQLEKMLNDYFDTSLRRIYIRHNLLISDILWLAAEEQSDTYLYSEVEYLAGTAGEAGTSGLISQEYWNLEGEDPGLIIGGTDGTAGTSGEVEVDFEIVAPSSLMANETQMRAYVIRYVQAGRRFRFTYI